MTRSAAAVLAGERARGRLLLLAVAAAAVAIGCGGSSSAPGGSPNDGGTGGRDGGATDANVGCRVTLSPVPPQSVTDIAAGPTVRLRVRGAVTGPIGAVTAWSWSVTYADGSALPLIFPMAADDSLVEFPIPRAGSYTVAASVGDGTGRTCTGLLPILAKEPGARTAFYAFRMQPPAGTFPAQQTEPVAVLGGTPEGDAILKLDRGTTVTLAPRHAPDGSLLAAYVRVTETTSGLVQEGSASVAGGGAGGGGGGGGGANGMTAAATAAPATFKLPPGRYDVLVVPEGTVPPLLIRDKRPDELATMALMLDDGVPVEARVADAAGAPVSGARMSLRAGVLPSTVGTSNAAGVLSLRTRPGTHAVTVVPGSTLRGWELSVPITPGVAVPAMPAMAQGAAATPLAVAVRLSAIATARVRLSMTGAGAGSKLLLETLAPIADAAEVEIGGVTRTAGARLRMELAVGPAGDVEIPSVPRAHYRAVLFAAAATGAATAAPASITSLNDLDATAGDINRTMAIAPPVTISGALGADAQDARVVAVDEAAQLTVAPEAAVTFLGAVGAAGTFSLFVNPSRVYRLSVDPPPGGRYARMLLPAVTVMAAPVTVPTSALPRGLLRAGRVVNPLLQPVPGVLVTAHCVTGAPGCVDATRPVAESVTAGDGSFRLILPDPGSSPP